MHATGPHISPQWIKRVQNPVQHVRSCRGRARVHRLRALPHQYSEGLVERFILQTKPSDLSWAHVNIRPSPARPRTHGSEISTWVHEIFFPPNLKQIFALHLLNALCSSSSHPSDQMYFPGTHQRYDRQANKNGAQDPKTAARSISQDTGRPEWWGRGRRTTEQQGLEGGTARS